MSNDYESRISDLAYELAKKDAKYVEKDDNNDQRKLKYILFNSNINKETIKSKIENIFKELCANPNFEVTKNTKSEILNTMEQHLISGNLESISQINDKEFLSTSIVEQVIQNDVVYNQEVSKMLENSYMKNSNLLLTGNMINLLISGKLSNEKLNELENIFENSKPIMKAKADSVDKILNGDEEEQKEGASYLSAKNAGGDCKYFKENHDSKATRGAIFIIMRKALSGDANLMNEACIKAAQFGLNNFINEDGTINIDNVHGKMLEVVAGEPKLMKRFSTKEKLIEEVHKANERGRDNQIREYSKDRSFAEKWNNCDSQEKKEELLRKTTATRIKEIETFSKIKKSAESGNLEEVKKLVSSLIGSDRHNVQFCISKILENADVHELDNFVFDSFGSKNKTEENKDLFSNSKIKVSDSDEGPEL